MHELSSSNNPLSLLETEKAIGSALDGWMAARRVLSNAIQSYLDACVTLHAVCISPSTRRSLKHAAIEDALITVDSELDSLVSDAKTLLSMQFSLATMRNKSATLARINTLPPEILANILVQSRSYCVHDDEFFCDLASVCAYWREVALNTTELWTHVDVGPDTPPGLMSLLLERSRASPLYLHMFEPEPPGFGRMSDLKVAETIKVLKPYVHRVHSLDVESYSYFQDFVSTILNLWLDHGSTNLPRLLKVSRPFANQIISPDAENGNGGLSRSENAEGVLSSLNKLYLHGVQFDPHSGAYRGLDDLQLDFAGYVYPISNSQLANMLSTSSRLTILKLRCLTLLDDPSQIAPVLLGRLKVLNVVDTDPYSLGLFLSLIVLPNTSAELSVGIQDCSTEVHGQLQGFLACSNISTLYWRYSTVKSTLNPSLFGWLNSLQMLILYRADIYGTPVENVQDEELPVLLPQSFSCLPRVIMLACAVNFDGLKTFVANHSVQSLSLERCGADGSTGQNLEDIRALLLQVYPELDCSISNTDSTAGLPCRTMFTD